MSRHHAQARCGARDVRVVAGYDRPLHEVFLQVLTAHDGDHDAEEDVLYASVHEPWRDWTDVATVTGQLARLGIVVPDSLLKAVRLDQKTRPATAWSSTTPADRRPSWPAESPTATARWHP